MSKSSLGLSLCAWVLFGCGAAANRFDAVGFRSGVNPYYVAYADSRKRLLISDAWRVDNFRYSDGIPDEPKEEGEYKTKLSWSNPDGEELSARAETFELLLSHNTNAEIFVRTLPVPASLLHKEVQFLAENYVNGFSGSVYSYFLGSAVGERRVATKILRSTKIGFQGHHAQSVTFEYVSLNQLELDPNAPRTRALIVLVRAPLLKVLETNNEFQVRAYLMLGYANDAEHFDEQLPAFYEFTKRIHLP